MLKTLDSLYVKQFGLPKGYGIAWRVFDRDAVVVLPVPLNYILRWLRQVRYNCLLFCDSDGFFGKSRRGPIERVCVIRAFGWSLYWLSKRLLTKDYMKFAADKAYAGFVLLKSEYR